MIKVDYYLSFDETAGSKDLAADTVYCLLCPKERVLLGSSLKAVDG